MNKIYKSLPMRIAGIGSIIAVALEIISSFTNTFETYHAIFSFIFIIIIAPVCFIILLIQSRKLNKEKLGIAKTLSIIIGFVLLEIFMVIPLANISAIVSPDVPSNEIVDIAQGSTVFATILILWQLLGEEAIVLSLFFLIYKGYKYDENRKLAFWSSWLISSILFGLLHLSTYGFNYFHCIVVIGLSTMGYALLWKMTARPSLMYAVHVVYDVVLIALALSLS